MKWWEVKLKEATYVDGYCVHVRYSNALEADVDLSDLLSHPFYAPLKDKSVFAKVKVGEEVSVLVWPNDIDLAPEFLYERAQQANQGSISNGLD
jgi:hypothetical protein